MTIKVDYYTDVLCIWAWIAERRQKELREQFGDDIDFNYRYVNVFGDTQVRIGEGWEKKGGFEAFGGHVKESAAPFQADIGQADVLAGIASEEDLDVDAIIEQLTSGAASAEIMRDLQMAQEQGIKGSPSWVLDGGRQVLYGNVGYRVLQANAAELLNQPQGEASWC